MHQLLKFYCFTIYAISTLISNPVFGNNVEAACSPNERICYFSLVISYRLTMVLPSDNGDAWQPVTAEEDGLRLKNSDCSSGGRQLSEEEASRVITTDGSYRRVIAVNGSIPGPPIIVYHGQEMVVSVTNAMINDVTSVHFHGLHQRNTPWMDGVSGLTQCPIVPGQTFTYRMMAEPSGTFWWHSHSGDQFSMGVYGPLIVLDRTHEQTNAKRGNDPLPSMSGEFYGVVQDWTETDSTFVTLVVDHGLTGYSQGLGSDTCFSASRVADGTLASSNHFVSALVNGRGWRYSNSSGHPDNPNVPLETFVVAVNGTFRFRIVSASMAFGFRVAIDNHPLHMVAMDGHDISTAVVDAFMIFPGERFDFYITADDPLGVGNYWMRYQTLEEYDGDMNPMTAHHVESVVRYEGASEVAPTTTAKECTREDRCIVLNCPYRYSSNPATTHCVHFTAMTLPVPNDELWAFEDQNAVSEIFLNFGLWSVGNTGFKPAVNGISMSLPVVPLQVYAEDSARILEGECEDCPELAPCSCAQIVEMELNSTVDLVLTSEPNVPIFTGTAHPIHIHGFTPQIVDVGFPLYDPVTRMAVYGTPDISSEGGFGRNNSWTNPGWAGGRRPWMLGPWAPRKDTVAIPVGGYVVMRFRADSPGFWFMHCHTEYHGIMGMGVILKVGNVTDMTRAPERMRSCGNFQLTESEFYGAVNRSKLYREDMLERLETN